MIEIILINAKILFFQNFFFLSLVAYGLFFCRYYKDKKGFFKYIFGISFLFFFSLLASYVINYQPCSLFLIFIFSIIPLCEIPGILKNEKKILISFFFLTIINTPFVFNEIAWYDTYLYHANQVSIIKEYGVVQGIGLIHERLGFNSIAISFYAMVDFFSNGYGIYISNIFILNFILFFLVRSLYLFKSFLNFAIFILFLIHFLVLRNDYREVTSYSTDFIFIHLVFLFFSIIVNSNIRNQSFWFGQSIFALLLFFLKLSGIAFLFITFSYFIFSDRMSIFNKKVSYFLIISFFVFSLMAYRSVISTGWLYYPIPFFSLDLPWSLGKEQVEHMNLVIKAWAIYPGEAFLERYQNKSSIILWFPDWLNKNFELNSEFVLIFLLFLADSLFRNPLFFLKNKNVKVLYVFLSLNILFYLFTVPDFRFFSSVVSLLLLFPMLHFQRNIRFVSKDIVVLFIMIALFLVSYANIRKLNGFSIKKVRDIELYSQKNYHGLLFLKPKEGEQCGFSEIPCAPGYTNARYDSSFNMGFVR
ncbi:hypothetical protein AB3N58_09345 [Leptospira sp. WS60.C2]